MLDEGRRTEMIYFLKEVVSEAGVSDKLAEPFMASLAAKGSGCGGVMPLSLKECFTELNIDLKYSL